MYCIGLVRISANDYLNVEAGIAYQRQMSFLLIVSSVLVEAMKPIALSEVEKGSVRV